VFARLRGSLKNRFLDLKNISFLFAKEIENFIAGTPNFQDHRFLTSPKSHLGLGRRQNKNKQVQAPR
jgi:hypothetical protein